MRIGKSFWWLSLFIETHILIKRENRSSQGTGLESILITPYADMQAHLN